MDSGWLQAYIGIAAAVIAVGAAFFSLRQATAARRQAAAAHGDVEPTFHIERGHSDGRPPWRFTLTVNNFNRRAMVVDLIAIKATSGIIVYDQEASVASIFRAATSTDGTFRFDLTTRPGNILNGIAPNSGMPTCWSIELGFGPSDQMVMIPNQIEFDTEITWRYAGERTNRKAKTFERIGTRPDA